MNTSLQVIRFAVRALLFCFFATHLLQVAPAQTNGTPENQEKVKALNEEEMEQAMQKVRQIVNQPVARYPRRPGMDYTSFREGWFHPGATKPPFPVVDVRTTQEFPYDKYPWVTSELNPGVVFAGGQLEFNSMTKYFYTDRTVPKKKLAEAEMLEINRLYRIIGRCEHDLRQLKLQKMQLTEPEETSEVPALEGEPVQPAAKPILPWMPRIDRVKGAMALGVVLVLYVAYRIFRK